VLNNSARGIYDPGTADDPAKITNNIVSNNSTWVHYAILTARQLPPCVVG